MFKNNQVMYNISILVAIGLFTKVLALVNRLLIIRIIGIEGISIYTLSFPTIMLFLSLAQFGLPTTISKYISEDKTLGVNNSKNLIMSAILFSLSISGILILILVLILDTLVNNWIKSPDSYYPILVILPLIPLSSLSGILKGYFNGLNRADITAKSTFYEQITRISLSIIFTLYFIRYSVVLAITASFFSIFLGEIVSLIYLFLKIKNRKIDNLSKEEIKLQSKRILAMAPYLTSNILAISLSHFIEPIVFIYAFSLVNTNVEDAKNIYSYIVSFALPMATLFLFIPYSIATVLLPKLTEYYTKGELGLFNNVFKKTNFYILMFGTLFNLALFKFPSQFLNFMFGSSHGSEYLEVVTLFMIPLYLHAIYSVALQAVGDSNHILKVSVSFNIIRTVLIYLLVSNISFMEYGFIIAIISTSLLGLLIHHFKLKYRIMLRVSALSIIKYSFLVIVTLKTLDYISKSNISILIGLIFMSLIYSLLVTILFYNLIFSSKNSGIKISSFVESSA